MTDLTAQQEVDDFVDLNQWTPKVPEPGAWQGLSLRGLMRPSAGAARSLLVAGAAPAVVKDKLMSLRFGEDTTASQDTYFDSTADLGNRVVDYWTPAAGEVGGAAQVVNGLSQIVGSIPQIVGTSHLFLLNSALDPATDLVNQGVDADTAGSVGFLNLGVNALGLRLPAAFGAKLGTRVATGAGVNLAAGAVADAGSAAYLQQDGADAQAAQFDVFDPTRRFLDVALGAVFGASARTSRSDQAAVLTTRNADHFQSQTMPGVPRDGRTALQHQNALSAAVEQVLAGEKVSIADTIPDAVFAPRALPATAVRSVVNDVQGSGFDSAVARVLKDEGGFVADPADRGGATNFGISSRAHPDVDVRTLTRDGAMALYRERYWDAIGADEIPAQMRATAFDAAVNQGVPWTKKALAKAGGDVAKFNALREQRYRAIVDADPTQAKFLNGWMNRLDRYRKVSPASVGDDATLAGLAARVVAAEPPAAAVEPARTADAVEPLPRDTTTTALLDEATPVRAPDLAPREAQRAPEPTVAPRAPEAFAGPAEPWKVPRATEAPAGGSAPAGKPSETRLDAALRLVGEAPDAMVLAGLDADGAPSYRAASEFAAEVKADYDREVADAQAYTAAANCFLRRGFDAI